MSFAMLALSVLGLLCFNTSAAIAQSNSPQTEFITQLTGKTCDIYSDAQGIPHVRVTAQKNDELLGFACLGFVHARERSWQMDFLRRTVQGRKAEILGKEGIQSDFLLRLLGLSEKADELFSKLDSRYQKVLTAYSFGVNRGLKAALKRGVYEFEKLGYKPEEWRPQDSLAIILLQAFDQTKLSFQSQFEEKNWLNDYGDEAAMLFSRNGLPWDVSILKPGEYAKGISLPSNPSRNIPATTHPKSNPFSKDEASSELKTFFKEISSPWDGPGIGSNNWVIDGKFSKTGNAWLANDPHLKLGRPAFWHWIHLQAGQVDVIGATLPGVPVFASATNRHLSWGLTNSFLPAARVTYVPRKDLNQAKTTRPWIWVRFWKFKLPFFFKTFERTPSGLPILPLDAPDGKAVVLRWTGFDLGPHDATGLLDLLTAETVGQADAIFSRVQVPSWNFVFADDRGQIGYRAVGRIARFEKEPPLGITQESLAAVEHSVAFNKPLSGEEMPHVLRPKRGYIATANNKQWPTDSRFSGGKAQLSGFRAYRIEELLNQTKFHDLSSIQKIQCDLQAVDARFIVPELIKVLDSDENRFRWRKTDAKAIQVLRDWNFETNLDCTACAIYRRWMDHIFAGQNLNTDALYRKLVENPDKDLQKTVLTAFHVALDDLGYGGTHKLPLWGAIHLNFFHHLAGNNRFSVKPMSTPGDENTVNPGTSEWNGKLFDHYEGASQRIVVEMSRPPQVFSVLSGSNQDDQHTEKADLADPASEWQKWAHCELHRQEFPFEWNQVKDKVEKVVLQ